MDLIALKGSTDSMELALQQLIDKTGPTLGSGSDVDHSTFKSRLYLFCNKLSAAMTKLSFIFSKEPMPTAMEANELFNAIESTFVDVLATYYTLPKEQGESMHAMVHKALTNLLSSVVTLVKTFSATGAQIQKERLALTAQVWEACSAMSQIPENNREAVIRNVQETEELVADALNEIEEEVKCNCDDTNEDTDDSASWTSADKMLLPPCVGLVKTVRACVKKIRQALGSKGMCDNTPHICQLDKVASLVALLSPSVDNFITSVYPPMDRNQVQIQASLLTSQTENLLKMSQESHFVTNEEQVWVDFLFKALVHNNCKLQSLLVI